MYMINQRKKGVKFIFIYIYIIYMHFLAKTANVRRVTPSPSELRGSL